ncbi:hypothetical protein [Nocardia aurantiaca]|uniref:Uncharacterized protein n=1 Tax=Nocardia aurantiaca TaxID=2675850 RepID=A0A6I3L047_9NOCA|nr:hypothetical protein [Nocardia aurantiaca]MTE16333.1 hypothetical protein [Nocardia aurantiaca]
MATSETFGADAYVVRAGLWPFRHGLRGEIMFAVHSAGIYFGAAAASPAQTVPWSRICAVELFTETTSSPRSQSTYRCIGVRARGTTQPSHGGPAARPIPESSARILRGAGRPDLIPGADGTIRWAYRRMSGWRVSRARLSAAVARHAPQVPVIDGPSWPPALTWSEALAARKSRRRR